MLEPGKIPAPLLAEWLARPRLRDPRVRLAGEPGVDAAVIDLGDRLLVAKSDPITFAAERVGWYAVQVNANDLAVMGATPRWLLATLLLPPGMSEAAATAVFDDLLLACDALTIDLVGGHSEVTIGLDRPIVVGCLLGEAAPEELVTPRGARPGDALIQAGAIAIEGTAVLGREAADALVARGVDQRTIAAAAALLDRPGISVLPAARALRAAARPHAMHDPTEGGLATALAELATAAGLGLRVWRERVIVRPETAAICRACGLDPWGLLASGSLLAAVAPGEAEPALAALEAAGIPAAVIGELLPASAGLWLQEGEEEVPLPSFARDELARFLAAP